MLEFIEVTTALGSKKETNSDISDMVNWSSEEIYEKTGIKYRYISDSKQTAETLALEAADKIQKKRLDDIDLVVSVSNTQEDDFPPIANFVHSYLDLNKNAHCYGLNHGCSGYVDALKLVYSFFSSGFSRKAIIITSDTYSKFIHKDDRSIRTLFSDGATCTVIEKNTFSGWNISDSISNSQHKSQEYLNRSNGIISMDGPQVLLFSINTVMKNLIKILPDEPCLLFPHQAGKIVLNKLKSKLPQNISVFENYELFGNLVSSSIPNLLKEHLPFKSNKPIILSGFGVGLSHSSIILKKNK